MKIVCKNDELISAINIALRAVSSKTTMAVLECLFIEARNGKILMTSNNMELGIKTEVPGRIDEEGQVAVNAKIFSDIARKLPVGSINISVDENYSMFINCGKAKFRIAAQSGNDFPVLPEIKKDSFITISEFTLKEVIRQTIFAVSDNEATKIMTGEHFEINGKNLTVTALDGHRIAIRNIELKKVFDDKDVIIPGKTLNEISKIIEGDAEKEIVIYFSQNNILFELENTIVLSRLIEGKYLNVKQMISPDFDTKIKINKKELMDCIDRATLLVKESDKKPIIISIENSSIRLNMNTSIGTMDEEIDVEKDGNDLLIGFNPKFIMDVIKVIDEDEITIYMTNSKAPCFIRDEKVSYNYLILPVNFSTAR